MDDVDTTLLRLLQHDASTNHAALAEAVGLSVAGVHKRIRKLQSSGLIRKTVAQLDREGLGLDLLCFLTATFKTNTHTQNMSTLREATAALPEVLECYTLTGANDAVLKVTVRDHKHLREFLTRFSSAQDVIGSIQTAIVLEEIKETHELPIMTQVKD
jgi:DNA-binding Lrp family transcriptional regulator